MEQFLINFTYFGIAVALLARGAGLPLPEDIPLLVGGYLCAEGICHLGWLLPIAYVSVVTADCISYGIGRKFGRHVLSLPLLRRVLSEVRFRFARMTYRRHGKKTTFAARFMPALRSPMFFVAGTFKLPFQKFIIVDMLAALISVPVLVMLGYIFAEQVQKIRSWSQTAQYGLMAGILVVVLIAFLVARQRAARRRAQRKRG